MGVRHGVLERARSIMADASRLTRPDRRAVLGGLLVGATAASAPVTWARAEEKDSPPPSIIERIEIDARPIAHFERNPGGEAVWGA